MISGIDLVMLFVKRPGSCNKLAFFQEIKMHILFLCIFEFTNYVHIYL